MRRGQITDPEAIASEILFGSKGTAANLSAVSKCTGISVSTLSRYRKQPSLITIDRLATIAEARGLAIEDVTRLVTIYGGYKKHAWKQKGKF